MPFILFNCMIIALALLIAYWWANQGLFSAILHLVCTVAAAAVAFAFWEPLVVGVLLRGGAFDNYAWGASLVALFAVSLFVFRVIADKVAPANVNVPHWANLSFGGLAGAGAATISVGMLIIGLGFIQSTANIMGFEGYRRSLTSDRIEEINELWFPAHKITAGLYDYLSVNSLGFVSRPLRHYQPELAKQVSLFRDSFDEGTGQTTILPDAARVTRLQEDPDATGQRRIFVEMTFSNEAVDFGQMFTLTASQIRLVGNTNGKTEPVVLHPKGWAQQHEGYKYYKFSSAQSIVSSQPGKPALQATFEFSAPNDFNPDYIQVKNTRFELPVENLEVASVSMLNRMRSPLDDVQVEIGQSIDSAVVVSNDIRPIVTSLNNMPAGIEEIDRYLYRGEASFGRGGPRVSNKLRILGIFEPDGTRLVKVKVDWSSPANIFAVANQYEIAENSPIALIDSTGTRYAPIGYFWSTGREIKVKLEPTRRLPTFSDVPQVPASDQQTLDLLFYIPVGSTVTGLILGDIDVGTCNVQVEAARRR